MDKITITSTEKLPDMPTITWTTRKKAQPTNPPDQKKVGKVLNQLQSTLCEVYDRDWDEIIGKSRKPEVVSARFLYYYFLHVIYQLSANGVGKSLGQKHTTVLHAIHQVTDRLNSSDPAWDKFKERYLQVEGKLDTTLH